jgi:hypothetical protein
MDISDGFFHMNKTAAEFLGESPEKSALRGIDQGGFGQA